jgi:S1-C subfamily serine protease
MVGRTTTPRCPYFRRSRGNTVAGVQTAFADTVRVVPACVVEIQTCPGLGSGVGVRQPGDIVANDHLVGTATSLGALVNGAAPFSTMLVGTSAASDPAVVMATSPTPLTAATSGAVAALRVGGDVVRAMGNPLVATDPQIGGTAPGIGFATPVDTVIDAAQQLVSAGRVSHATHRCRVATMISAWLMGAHAAVST